MQNTTNHKTLNTIKDLIRQVSTKKYNDTQQQDLDLQKLIQENLVHLIHPQHNILHSIKDALTDPELSNSHKYILLMYVSLLDVDHSKIVDLSRFYYELTSHAIRELKEGKKETDAFWQNVCEKIYQYGMLLFVGSRSLLLNIESIGTRVNSQLFAIRSKEMRLNRLVKIYNCVLCIPQKYLTLKQTLYFTLIFTRWQVTEQQDENKSFFSLFMKKTQKKLIKKLKRYDYKCFNQEHILNLIKIILGGDQLVFSYFLQIKYTYEALKDHPNANIKAERSVFESIRKFMVVRENRHLFNFLIELLISLNDESVLKSLQRQSILFVCLKLLSGKFENNQQLFVILVRRLLQEQNLIISQISFRYIREQALQFLTVHKVKLLLNVFNIENWNQIKNAVLKEEHIFDRLEKIISLLGAVGRRYSENSLILYCQPERYCLSIKEAKNVRSLVFVASFDGIGRLCENQKLTMRLLRFQTHKEIFEVIIEFRESLESFKLQLSNESKERSANLLVLKNGKEMVNERVQYLRFGQGSFQSLITVSYMGKEENILAMCIDGAYYEFQCRKKIEIVNLEIGCIAGTIHSFYALKCQVEMIYFYKTWSEWNRKTKFVVYNLGTSNLAYRFSNKVESAIVDCNEVPTFAFLKSKTEISLIGTASAKQITFIDILLQLGGLQTIFYIFQRFSRGLMSFQRFQERINFLMANFFNCLKNIATLDESNIFLDDINNCFKYLNEFLFLLIKRNKMVSQTHNSNLMLSIFQLLVYFRFWKFGQNVPSSLTEKMIKIETSLVLQTLANFQIWSNCSISLQLFVLNRIEHYTKQTIYINIFIKRNLIKHLLSSLMLFQVSPDHISHYEQLQMRTIQLCTGLYRLSKFEYLSTYENNLQNNQRQSSYPSYLHRDQATCLTFLQFILKNASNKLLSASQKKAYEVITRFIIEIFLGNKMFLHLIGHNWNLVANMICEHTKLMEKVDRQVITHSIGLMMALTSMFEHYDIWVYRFVVNLMGNQGVSLNDGVYLLQEVMLKYSFQTSRKRSIIKCFLRKLQNKVRPSEVEKIIQFKELIKQLLAFHIYSLSIEPEFYSLLFTIKKCWFRTIANYQTISELSKIKKERQNIRTQLSEELVVDERVVQLQGLRVLWVQINEILFQKLYESRRINNINKQVAVLLIKNIYEVDLNHKCALMPLAHILINLQAVKELSQRSHYNIKNRYIKHGVMSAFSLIQHCGSWLMMFFLLQNGLLTMEKDLKIPFSASQVENIQSIGGTLGYYLSRKPSPIELYVILTIIMHRQLSNNITLLSVQSSLSIFQYSLEHLFEYLIPLQQTRKLNNEQLNNDNSTLLITIFTLVIKSLNISFINKSATIYKELDRMLSLTIGAKVQQTSWKKLKPNQILQSLSKASFRIQNVLQDNKIDRDISFFIQEVTSKLALINSKDHQKDAIHTLLTIIEVFQSNSSATHELQLKKLRISGIRFFQLSREYFLSIHHGTMYGKDDYVRQNVKLTQVSGKEMEQLEQYINQLVENFDNILQFYYYRDQNSEDIWENLLISNQYWFQLQGDIDDVTTKFYELDEKEIGPYGFYKLNIKPLRHDHQKLPYPRKKEYLQMRSKKQQQKKQKEMPLMNQRSTIVFNASTLYSTLSQSVIAKEKHQSHMSYVQKVPRSKKAKQYFCEYVTKKGVYAGTITKKLKYIQFNFTGYDKLPSERVYQTSTNKCHRIENLNSWQEKENKVMKIPFINLKVFTRRYIMRHTALEIFHEGRHRSYFFNLFYTQLLQEFLNELKESNQEIIDDRRQYFDKAQFTYKWRKGQLSNFQYISLINRFSGRSLNDLVQYHVFPWVITSYEGQNGWTQFDKDFIKHEDNMRNLSFPTGKLSSDKFNKLKARLREVDASDRQIRFLYGTMYSNPTVLYNFFIRLEPYTSLHWEHQGRKIDHADRLFSGVAEQFRTILTSSSDMKELTPEFYYWTEFLRNRNKIELGTKQKGEEVDSVVLPVWARTPQEFIFKMRQALQSNYVSSHLHEWIDLIFGYKNPYDAAQEHDNLYHYQCYEHDLFEAYETENQMKIAQITISQFGQVPEQIFFKPHPPRYIRQEMNIDIGTIIIKFKNAIGFEYNEAGILTWNGEKAIFKKVAINQLYNSFEWTREYESTSKKCILMRVNMLRWVELQEGTLKILEKGKVKMDKSIQSKCADIMDNYIFYGLGSKIVIMKIQGQMFQTCSTLYGHRDEIILIKVNRILDIIVSIDKNGYVLIHELTELRFLRAFQLGINFEGQEYVKLKFCIHHMGYYVFFDQLQTLRIFNFMGELLLDQDIEIKGNDSKEEEEMITDIQIFSQEHSHIMLSSTKGNIFIINFLEVIRFKELYPYKTYSRLGKNILANARSKAIDEIESKNIVCFALVRSVSEKNMIYQVLVLYESGELVAYSQEKQVGFQLQTNNRLKSMGFF